MDAEIFIDDFFLENWGFTSYQNYSTLNSIKKVVKRLLGVLITVLRLEFQFGDMM